MFVRSRSPEPSGIKLALLTGDIEECGESTQARLNADLTQAIAATKRANRTLKRDLTNAYA